MTFGGQNNHLEINPNVIGIISKSGAGKRIRFLPHEFASGFLN
jgi:hypothetical protein